MRALCGLWLRNLWRIHTYVKMMKSMVIYFQVSVGNLWLIWFFLKNSEIGVRCVLADRLAVTAALDGTLLWKPTVNFSVEKRSPRSIFEPISKCSQCTDTYARFLNVYQNKRRLAPPFAVRNFVVWRRCRLPWRSKQGTKKGCLDDAAAAAGACAQFSEAEEKNIGPHQHLFFMRPSFTKCASPVAVSWF